MKNLIVSVLALGMAWQGQAQVLLESFDNLNLEIPDDGQVVSDTRVLSTTATSIIDLSVSIQLDGTGTGAWNGDYYLTLTHDSGFSILLNRPGRRVDSSAGYSDSGFNNVTFNDTAANGDVHVYRLTALGNQNVSLGGPLSGTWAPDGRTTDPSFVLSTDARTALLSSFKDLNPNGSWTLAVTDLSSGGTGELVGWGMTIQVVPEPAEWANLFAVGLVCFAIWRQACKPVHPLGEG